MSKVGKILAGMIMESMRKQEERIQRGEQIVRSCKFEKVADNKTKATVVADLDGWCEDEFEYEFHNSLNLKEYDFTGKQVCEVQRWIHKCEEIYRRTVLKEQTLIDEYKVEKTETNGKYEVTAVISKGNWDEEKVKVGYYYNLKEMGYEDLELEFNEKHLRGMTIKQAEDYLNRVNKVYDVIEKKGERINECKIIADERHQGLNKIIVRTSVNGYAKKETLLYTYYVDELSFTELEFIGKTVKQAIELIERKDKAYLQS